MPLAQSVLIQADGDLSDSAFRKYIRNLAEQEVEVSNGLLEMVKRLENRLAYCLTEIDNLRETADWKRTTQDDAFDEGNNATLSDARLLLKRLSAQ